MIERFKLSAAIVARPIAVKPTTSTPFQPKCAFQICWRGLKIDSTSPVSGSSIRCRAPLRKEHDTQARAKLVAMVAPPAVSGTM